MSQHRCPLLLDDFDELARHGVTRDIRTDRMRSSPARTLFCASVCSMSPTFPNKSRDICNDGVSFDSISKILFKASMCFEIALLEGPSVLQTAAQQKSEGFTDVDCMISEFKRHGWTCHQYEVSDLDFGGIVDKQRLRHVASLLIDASLIFLLG